MTPSGLDTIYSPSDHVVAREIDGVLIIVPLSSGVGDMEDDLFSLNETGTAIWKLLDGQKTINEVVSVLTEGYQAEPKEIERDVLGIIAELLKRKMLAEANVA